MINPMRGPGASSLVRPRRTCTTRSGCTARIPYFTVVSNSIDRLMRLRADSTAKKPDVAIRQSARDGPCAAGRKRSPARRGCASASGSRAHELGAGCSAGRSACPWPRDSPRCMRHRFRQCLRPLAHGNSVVCGSVGVVLLLAGAVPISNTSGSQPYRRRSGDCLRVLTTSPPVKPGLAQPSRSKRFVNIRCRNNGRGRPRP
jgi:hypothetical protein